MIGFDNRQNRSFSSTSELAGILECVVLDRSDEFAALRHPRFASLARTW
jgi:hypothetical protein